jgi:carboxyl-terminal processing protease
MRLTTARYYTPSGRSIQAVGIEPDIVVEQARIETIDHPKLRREADLRGALENDNGDEQEKSGDGVKDQVSTEDKDAKKEAVDYQLLRALDLVRGLSLFSQKAAAASSN